MKSLSAAHLIGRVGREPELRYTPDGQAVTFLPLNLSRDLEGATPGTQVEFDLEEEGLHGGPQAFNIRQVH